MNYERENIYPPISASEAVNELVGAMIVADPELICMSAYVESPSGRFQSRLLAFEMNPKAELFVCG